MAAGMTAFSDLAPEAQAAQWRRTQDALARVDEANARMAERAERRRASGEDVGERLAERQRQREEQERAAALHREAPPVRRSSPPPSPPVGKIVHTTRDASGNLSAQVFDGDAAAAATGWEKYIRDVVRQKANSLIDRGLIPFAEEVAKDLSASDRRIAELEKRLAESEAATVDLLRQVEGRLANLEQRAIIRPSRPTLVSGDDVA